MARRDRKATKWLPLFHEFIKQLRIDSKEVEAIDDRGAPLNLWGSQDRFLEEVAEGLELGQRTFMFLKARQLGVTTISLAVDIFWMAMHPGMRGALVSDTDENREIFRTTISRYMNSFPPKFLGKGFRVEKHNKNYILWSNGSRLDYLVAGTKTKATWGESRGYAFAHLTECANYGNPAGLASFRETMAETHPNRLFIYESTAKGHNHWRDMWLEFGRDTMTKRRAFLGWYMKDINKIKTNDQRFDVYGLDPPDAEERELIKAVADRYGYDIEPEQLAWYRWRHSDQSANESDIHQNLPWTEEQAFVLSGYSFFQVRRIQKDLERVCDPDTDARFKGYRYFLGNDFFATVMEQIVDEERIGEVELRVWEEPVKGAEYVIGCDPAYGRNDWKDRHGISVWRCYADKLVQVAEYASFDCETRQAAWVLAHLAGAYRNCLVNVELNGPGMAVFTEFNALKNMLRAEMYSKKVSELEWEDMLATARDYLYHRPDSMGAGYAYHTKMTGNNKFEIMNQMRDLYVTNVLDISSAPMLEEMLTVVQDGAEISAPGRNKDDRVFAAAYAIKAWIDWIRTPMIHRGATYDRVTAEENGEITNAHAIVDRIVSNFFRSQEELAQQGEPEVKWMRDRGLV